MVANLSGLHVSDGKEGVNLKSNGPPGVTLGGTHRQKQKGSKP